MNQLIVPSLLPPKEREEYERKQKNKRIFALPITSPKKNLKPKLKPVLKKSLSHPIIKIEPNADLVWSDSYQNSLSLLKIDESKGIPEQILGPSGRDRELILGLDFGTSCVKVVIGDRGASKAYAVPFIDSVGINSYLLPSRIFEENSIFSISQGTDAHRDLKLRFLADSASPNLQIILVAFIALIIRRCRAWLYETHTDILTKRNILWKIVIGRAVDRLKEDKVSKIMAEIVNAAWAVAGCTELVNRETCNRELVLHRENKAIRSDFLEVSVIPELAAQIYGFVKSRQFDSRAKNFYLFIDVGAGTVDVSLFRVKSNEFGSWDFSLFTSVVEPNGAMNLHRARLDWWHQEFSKTPNNICNRLIEKISFIKLSTEQTQPIPEKYFDYFKGIKMNISDGGFNPDEIFYKNRLIPQVRGQGIHKTVQSNIVGRIDLENLPFFLCGGGSRLPLYQKISSALNNASDFKWLKAHRRDLGIPSELDAPGLAQIDYDRLSVAFGLSFVDVGTVVAAQAMPRIKQRSTADWRSSYTNKDVC